MNKYELAKHERFDCNRLQQLEGRVKKILIIRQIEDKKAPLE